MSWRTAALVTLAVAAALSVPAMRHLRERPASAPAPVALTLPPPEGSELATTGDLGLDLAIAPSQREIAFAASTAGSVQLWRRGLHEEQATAIAGTEGAMLPAFSADGTILWFFAGNRLRAVNLRTDERRDVLDAPAPGGVAVRGDGVLLVGAGTGPIIRLTNGAAENATSLRDGERAHLFPAWTGEGDAFVYLAALSDGRRLLRLRDGNQDVELTRSDSHGVVAAGFLVYVRDGALRAEPLGREPRRPPANATLATGVGVSSAGRGAFAVSERLLVWAEPVRRAAELRWLDVNGHTSEPLSEPGDFWQARLSPDGRTVVIAAREPLLRTFDLFTMPAAGGHPAPLTRALAADTDPVWSPDARRIAFRSLQEGQPQLFVARLGDRGVEPEVILYRSPLDEFPTDWADRDLIFHARSDGTGFDIWRLSPDGAAAVPFVRSPFNELGGRVSPDGRWLAYVCDEPGHRDVYLSRVSREGARLRVSTAGGESPAWAGGRAILFRRGDDLMRVELTASGETFTVSLPQRVVTIRGLRDFTIARGGTRLLAVIEIGARPAAARAIVDWPKPSGSR